MREPIFENEGEALEFLDAFNFCDSQCRHKGIYENYSSSQLKKYGYIKQSKLESLKIGYEKFGIANDDVVLYVKELEKEIERLKNERK